MTEAEQSADLSWQAGNPDVKERKTTSLLDLVYPPGSAGPRRILVVGCGTGLEAGVIARRFKVETTGIDVGEEFRFDHAGSAPARLMTMDAMDLSFPDDSFDFVYSFHTLEHIPDPRRALAEMRRVLEPGGRFVIGTPNKSRLVGYVGSAHPVAKKVLWNVKDWRMRLAGKWSNEAGAHAGFTEDELLTLCQRYFGEAKAIGPDYYGRIYAGRRRFLDTVNRSGLRALVYPCVYVSGVRPDVGGP